MSKVHIGLIILVLAAVAVGVFEKTPDLASYDPARHAEFKDTWNERIHISYWDKWTGFEGDACQAMVDEFNRSQDEIFVHLFIVSQLDRKSMLAIMGEDPPDVLGLWAIDIPHFAKSDALVPLDDLMHKSGLTREYYNHNYFQFGVMNDKVYALPTTPSSIGLFYNKSHFNEKAEELRAAGLDPERPPETIEELDRYATVLDEFAPDGSPKIMGFLHTEPNWYNEFWGYFFGGKLYDKKTNQITADHRGNVQAFLWAKQYAEKYGRDKLLQFKSGFGSFDSPQNAFMDGKVSMQLNGVWFPNFIRRHRPRMDFGVAPFPSAEGVPGPRTMVDTDVITIPKGCRHPHAAWKFIHYVQTDGLPIICRLQGKHMPLANTPDWFYEGHPNLELEVFEQVAESPHAFFFPRIGVSDEYAHELYVAFQHIWNWPVPESELIGLTGENRETKVRELCLKEIRTTLASVRKKIQAKHETILRREALRVEGK